jgi:hypothetical protein
MQPAADQNKADANLVTTQALDLPHQESAADGRQTCHL